MITKITMNQVASYKNPATLVTEKKVNLIYGLNGTGKSTLSDYLYSKADSCFSSCSINGLNNEEILVYNQKFIKDYFYEPDNLKGIFTLSKENKEAEQKIKNAEEEIKKLESEIKLKSGAIDTHTKELSQKKQFAENKTWDIKSKYTGGDRVFEYCLTNLMGKKESLFVHISGFTKPTLQPVKTTFQLKKEIEAIKGNTAQKYNPLPVISLNVSEVESDSIFTKSIIGNENSSVAELIKKINNSDWVKQGLVFLPDEVNEVGELCPFCQERTITKALVENIKSFFDEAYERDINKLKQNHSLYKSGIDAIPDKSIYETNLLLIEKKSEFNNLFNAVLQLLEKNKDQINEKLKSPSVPLILNNSDVVINSFNEFIKSINESINIHNTKIDNKEASLAEIKKQFWQIMRWDYDQTISTYLSDKQTIEKKIADLTDELSKLNESISKHKLLIIEQQKKTINIELAIANINNGLIELGIDGFKIEKYSDILYQMVRTEQCNNTFHTLSEGEKMIISFLYFRELCKGKRTATSHTNNKIIIIDDPISSLYPSN